MTKLSQAEIETIKHLLDVHGKLPAVLQERLFPSSGSTIAKDKVHHEKVDIAQSLALPPDAPDMAAIARANEIHLWEVPRLWYLAASLPVEFISVKELVLQFETARWLGDAEQATVGIIIEHARRILNADLKHPIILSSDKQIMDGMHRLAKAWISDTETIAAVQFPVDPEPNYRIPQG